MHDHVAFLLFEIFYSFVPLATSTQYSPLDIAFHLALHKGRYATPNGIHESVRDAMSYKERIQAEVDAIYDHCRGEPREKQIEWINFCLRNRLNEGWHQIDCDDVEDRVRFRLSLPKR